LLYSLLKLLFKLKLFGKILTAEEFLKRVNYQQVPLNNHTFFKNFYFSTKEIIFVNYA